MTTQEYISCLIRQYQRVPCLEAGEEADLVRRWQELGDEEARRRLVTANMRHVVAIARRFSGRSVRMEDLLAEGCLGLLV
jgi:RNA polymerase primary sigma factor